MTSLTSELNNPNGLLYQWFEYKQSIGGDRLIHHHNKQMNRNQIIKPSGKIDDFCLIGTAAIYAFRWHLNILKSNYELLTPSYRLE